MTLILTFCVVFVAGPVAFWGLTRQPPTRRYVAGLCGLAGLLLAAAFAFGSRWLWDLPYAGPGEIMALWFAWVVVLALCVLAVRGRLELVRLRRLAFAVGAMATTLPWFGLYAAQMVAQ